VLHPPALACLREAKNTVPFCSQTPSEHRIAPSRPPESCNALRMQCYLPYHLTYVQTPLSSCRSPLSAFLETFKNWRRTPLFFLRFDPPLLTFPLKSYSPNRCEANSPTPLYPLSVCFEPPAPFPTVSSSSPPPPAHEPNNGAKKNKAPPPTPLSLLHQAETHTKTRPPIFFLTVENLFCLLPPFFFESMYRKNPKQSKEMKCISEFRMFSDFCLWEGWWCWGTVFFGYYRFVACVIPRLACPVFVLLISIYTPELWPPLKNLGYASISRVEFLTAGLLAHPFTGRGNGRTIVILSSP